MGGGWLNPILLILDESHSYTHTHQKNPWQISLSNYYYYPIRQCKTFFFIQYSSYFSIFGYNSLG